MMGGTTGGTPPLPGEGAAARQAVFAIEQLELHAKTLATNHRVKVLRHSDLLLKRLADSEREIGRCYDLMSAAHADGRHLTPAADWLLDNHYLIEEQVDLARKHFPPGYSRQLPRLVSGEMAGRPRVYDLVLEFIAHVDASVDDEALARYITAYQTIAHLTLGELWSIAIMLRLALIENLRRVTAGMECQWAHRDSALMWARRMDAPSDNPESPLLALSDMVRANPALSTAFVAQFTQALRNSGPASTFVMAWLEQRLAECGQTIEGVVRAESQAQAAAQASMANSIASLRLVNSTPWYEFVEANSAAEKILRGEPAGVYARMDFATRDEYRHVVEATARRFHRTEEEVAQAAVSLASSQHALHADTAEAHVGFVLVDDGRPLLLAALAGKRPPRLPFRKAHGGLKLTAYLGVGALLTAAGAAWLVLESRAMPGLAGPLLAVCAAVVASQCAIAVVNWVASLLRKPRALPRMDFEHGIPDDCRTMVVVPTMLVGRKRIAALIENLELRYLANRDPNLWFGLLTDFADAPSQDVEGDEALLAAAGSGIEELNAKYGNGRHGRFFLFHRPRIHNPQEGCFMGRERKRGKIEEFNSLLCGGSRDGFSRIVGDISQLTSIRYVITLDTDTDLPWGAGWRLVGAAAHPLNRPMMAPGNRRLARGYAILQPRVSISLRSAVQSVYSRLLSGDVGIDPYTRLVSDLYQDLFSETSFIGKGIYDVGAFRTLLDGRFPDNAVLSHDLLESCYARSGQCSDVELIEESPSGYLADASRRHRWMRGDWQIAPWLGLSVRNAAGRRGRPSLQVLGWWKIFDNLRRTFLAPAYVLLLVLAWVFLPSPHAWTLAVLGLLVVPDLLPSLSELWHRPLRLPLRVHLAGVGRSTLRRLARSALWLTFIPFEAALSIDAATRSLWRMVFSGRHLLEWQTAAAVERSTSTDVGQVFRRMWAGPVMASLAAVLVVAVGAPGAWVPALPLLSMWLLSPLVAWWVSQPLRPRSQSIRQQDTLFLRRIARLTWRYFEVFSGQQENWLPPDNFQEGSGDRVAHRTSPTDMGLALLSNLAAHDLGYLSGGQLLERTSNAISTMEQLERHRGHFFNWYETRTLSPLQPLYVSTVDSGNLVGHLRVLASGLLELPGAPALPAGALEGLKDTLRVLAGSAGPSPALDAVERLLRPCPDSLSSTATWLRELAVAAAQLNATIDSRRHPEAAWWSAALDRQVQSLLSDLIELAPWLSYGVEISGSKGNGLEADIDRASSLEELGELAQQAVSATGGTSPSNGNGRMAEAYRIGAGRIAARIRRIEDLASRCTGLTDAEFQFLYDSRQKLLSIGFWVTDCRLDRGHYDLLASEARLASYVAIASGQIPFEHWFALGRRLTTARGRQVLLSWSGSMFEYLMPLLVMPGFTGTLLGQTCEVAVARQEEYGRQRGRPWGISESGYNVTDAEGTYQYRAFGVPGLGLQRGLGDDLVIAPYATALALLVDPRKACANLRRMEEDGYVGPYGFFEAIDFTPARAAVGSQGITVVRSFMAHHHGMTLLAAGQVVLGKKMQKRFLQNPDFRAATLLLQERIPKETAILRPHAREPRMSLRGQEPAEQHAVRVIADPSPVVPEIHLLSNGRYHVMVSSAGSGYSRWNDLALTRWREDPTSESLGIFCYVGDRQTGRTWSNSFQPTLTAADEYEAVFTSGGAEFRRKDDQVETHTHIAVSTEDDVEIRRIKLTNRSPHARSLLVTSYAEVVLAPGVADELHRVFNGLFASAELAPEHSAILVTRCQRSPDEPQPWMFCLMPPGRDQVGDCSFDTDRALCIGRNRSLRNPAMLDEVGPLSGSAGPVLDPCMALRRSVELPVAGSVQLDLILGAAPSREAAVAMILKYQDHRMADRVFEAAATNARAVLSHLGVTEAEAHQYGRLSSAAVFSVAACRGQGSILRRNRKGQAGLWGHGISGDYPIVLLRMGDPGNLPLVRSLVAAHAYWRMRGLITDLVIWNEDASGYRSALNDELLGLIAAGTEAQLLDRPGGVFVRHIDSFPEDDRVLLQTVARVVVRDTDGPLEQQLERWRRLMPPQPERLPPERQAPRPQEDAAPVVSRDDLLFANGTGGFTMDGREYIIDLSPGRTTPAPWVNVIANPRIGTVVSEAGSAYTWYRNAQLCRLTPWSNDPVSDPSGEVVTIRDDASGRFFSPTPWPHATAAAYRCRHGFGYSIFEHTQDKLESTLTTYVAAAAPVKFLTLKIKNLSTRKRSISVFASVDLVLGDLRSRHAPHVVTELEPLTGAILARNSYNGDFADTVAFFDCSEAKRTVSGDRTEILGRNRNPADPAALRKPRLSGKLGPGLDPCAAMQVSLELAGGTQREVVFILGAADSVPEAIALIERHRGVAAARVALEEVWRFWNEKLGVLHAQTPDAAMDVLMNGWLPYQVLSCRLWGRSGFYQSGGAYGFRDQLQDCLSLLHQMPELTRQHLLRCGKRQFVEGDVQHWWHPPVGRGVRTTCSDDYLWLPYAAACYVAFTRDTGVLDEPLSYLTGRALGDGEDSYYDLPECTDYEETLYEHCKRSILNGLKVGAHGLPLMGSGDWNDGMSRVGHRGQGESVWLGFFLHEVLSKFSVVAKQYGDEAFATRCIKSAGELATQIQKHGWDGEWYLRAYFDDGAPLGSAKNVECRIDSLPQSWATIAGVGDPGRRRQALESTWNHLVRQDLQVVQLLDPPFDSSAMEPGYIKGYPPGVRENGGQYTHAAVWVAMAMALSGRKDQAAALVSMLNPINHALDQEAVELYKVEPYALSADIYSQPPHAGRGGWTWYSGSAAWLYRLMHEVIYGIHREADSLSFQPRVQVSWSGFTLHYRYYDTFYHLLFTQALDHQGQSQVTLDGKKSPDGILRLVNDRQEHAVEILFGPGASIPSQSN